MRLSCSALAEFVVDGKFVLVGSRKHWERNERRVLTPIGGAIEAIPTGKAWLIDVLGARRFEGKSLDLRFRMDTAELPNFRQWFNSNVGLESNAMGREWLEELGPKEHGLLDKNEVRQARFKFLRQVEHLQPSARLGHEGIMTHCFFRFYKPIEVPERILEKLRVAAEDPTTLLELVTPEEIVKGEFFRKHGEKVRRGEIPNLNKYLLDC